MKMLKKTNLQYSRSLNWALMIFTLMSCLMWAVLGHAGTGAEPAAATSANASSCSCPSPTALTGTPAACGSPSEKTSRYMVGKATCPASGGVTITPAVCQYNCFDAAKAAWIPAGELRCSCTGGVRE